MSMVEARRRGFTLIELMIVIAIIAIIVALAIPSLLNARKSANESSAISSLRTVATVNQQYRVRFGSYPSTIGDLGASGYIDSNLASASKSGYDFLYVSGGGEFWVCRADPTVPGTTGERYFMVDTTGVIRFSSTGPAGTADPPID